MTIDWWTIGLQTVNFLVLVWLLQRFLYQPVLAVIARRKEQVDLAFSDAEQARAAAATEQQRLQGERAELAQSRQALLSEGHREIEADRVRVLDDARSQAGAMLESARRQIATERDAAFAETRIQVADLAMRMAGALLRDLAGPADGSARWNDAQIRQMSARIDHLAEPERLALRQDVTAESGILQVVTATELSAADQTAWRSALEERLGPIGALEFAVDADLIGGAELRFPHAVLSLAWSDLLRRGRDALLTDANAH